MDITEMEENKNTTHELSMHTLPKVAMVVIVGLPGSGKTTLCKALPHILGCEYHVVHVCYDELVPFYENWAEEDNHGAWKKERTKVLYDAELFLCRVINAYGLKNIESNRNSSEQNKDINLVITEKSKYTKTEEKNLFECGSIQNQILCESLSSGPGFSAGTVPNLNTLRTDCSNLKESNYIRHNYSRYSTLHDTKRNISSSGPVNTEFNHVNVLENKVILVCVDDNLYYHSMRKEWWNLAAKYKMPFCTLVLNCDVETCIKRVRERENNCVKTVNVLIDSIVRMARRLEFPDKNIYPWEKYYCIIDSNAVKLNLSEIDEMTYSSSLIGESSLKEFSEIKAILFRSLKDPAKPLNEEVTSDHVVTTPSVIHEVDLALRQIVAKSDVSAKGVNNRKRKVVLDDLKNGKLCIPASILAEERECRKEKLEIYLMHQINSI